MPVVYIETSIVSYLRARQASQVVAAARQLLTKRWWEEQRANYQLAISQYVLDEAAKGDAELAAERLNFLLGIPLLAIEPATQAIADKIISSAVLPPKAEIDALHIAVAAYHRTDYLLTWNCTHIANARTIPSIRRILADFNLKSPEICTPGEMLDDEDDLNP